MMRLVFPLLLLAMPVWAGESSSASGALRVQMGAVSQPGMDSSRCFLKGESVPCVGHAYDQRIGSVAVENQGSVVVDRDLLQSMIREAEQQGGSLKVIQSPCYQKMQEAMKDAEKHHFWPIISVTVEEGGWPDVGSTDYGCDELCRAKKRVQELEEKRKKDDALWEARKRWNTTMKECVQ